MSPRLHVALPALALAFFLVSGCGDGEGTGGPDAGPIGEMDAGDPCAIDPSAPGCGERCTDTSCPAGEVCAWSAATGVRCECPSGQARDAEDRCVAVEACEPGTCSGHGLCEDGTGAIECTCDTGFAGERCERCDEAGGYQRNHAGECVRDLCDPSPCDDPARLRCVVEDGAARCECTAGTHDEDGACVPDTTCSETTCNMRGTCSETAEGVTCECGAGTAGRFCERCDELAGWHEDGAGGCTMDPCTPSPCTTALETVCTVGATGDAECLCDPGAHREGPICVPDEACASDTCAAGGTCMVEDGRTRCECSAGYAGPRCAECAEGFHDDGAGGCTSDPCTPNPCTAANRGQCSASGTTAVCGCDPGYHEDGVGGCTNDPCTPSPCAATGQACRVTEGTAECFTPICDDDNPCTDDAVVDGACVFTPRPDGSACSTTLCTAGQTCTGGACGGGTPVTCDDGNPCTRDACVAATGCAYVSDDTLVPSDGVACTVDRCAGGVATNTASDAACGDSLYCNGTERCAPSATGADARGCVAGTPPSPPGPSTPCRSYACDEASDSFALTMLPTGAACDDGLSCTTGDQCRASGVCTGTAQTPCPDATSCTGTGALASAIDVPVARVSGAITLGGAPLPSRLASSYAGGFSLMLVSRETEQRHYVAHVNYSGSSSTLQAGSDRLDAVLMPGVYDLVYSRGHDDGSDTYWPYVSRQAAPSELPNGYIVLREGVVIGAGSQTLDVDLPVARVSGAITLGGAPLPSQLASAYAGGFSLMLVSRATQQRHYVAQVNYSGSSSTLQAGSDRVNAVLVPGRYDLVYSRGHDDGSNTYWPYVSRQAAPSELPNGYVVLQEDVVIGTGDQTLDVDVPVARLSGAITLGGAPLPAQLASSYAGGFSLMLVSRATQQRHYVAQVNYSGSTSTLQTGSDRVNAVLVPGTYDLVYSRGHDDGSDAYWPYVSRQGAPSELPNGYVVLQEGVVIAAGDRTLDVDVPVARVSGAITLGGAPLPTQLASSYAGGFSLMLVSRATQQRHYVAQVSYSGSSSTLQAGTDRVNAVLVPGTYDLVYSRGHDDGSETYWPYVSRQAPPSELPNGYVVLQEGVVIGAGDHTLDVDVPVARLTGAITLAGAPLPARLASSYAGGFSLMLISRTTQQRHFVAHVNYSGSTSTLQAGSDRVAAVLVPGTYDLVYERGHDDGSNTYWPYVSRQRGPSELPNGYVVLQEGVVIAAGDRTLDVNVPAITLGTPITLEGAPLPARLASSYAGGFSLMLISRTTQQRHFVAHVNYSGSTSTLQAGSDVADGVLVPGTYDLVYERGHDDGSNTYWPYVSRQAAPSELPNGYARLQSCVLVE